LTGADADEDSAEHSPAVSNVNPESPAVPNHSASSGNASQEVTTDTDTSANSGNLDNNPRDDDVTMKDPESSAVPNHFASESSGNASKEVDADTDTSANPGNLDNNPRDMNDNDVDNNRRDARVNSDDVTMKDGTATPNVFRAPPSDAEEIVPHWLSTMIGYLRDVSTNEPWQNLISELIVFEKSGPPTGVRTAFILNANDLIAYTIY
jgi:hypothetical protein